MDSSLIPAEDTGVWDGESFGWMFWSTRDEGEERISAARFVWSRLSLTCVRFAKNKKS